MASWNAGQYLRFEEERSLPCRDLVSRLDFLAPKRIADLGCGPGNSTNILTNRWPDAEITGVDSSPEMLARAAKDYPVGNWRQGDIHSWVADHPYDLIFSNAALQWVEDHAALLPRLLGQLTASGALAVQMPGNFDAAPHRLMRETASSPAWSRHYPVPVREWHVHDHGFYYDVLSPHASRVDLWVTEYVHIMDGVSGIAEWYAGTGLRPFLDPLPDGETRDAFIADYVSRLGEEFQPQADGKVLFPFRRIFIIAGK